jgi:hypothetical protein
VAGWSSATIIYVTVEAAGAMRFGVHHRQWKLVREVPRNGGGARNYLFRIEEDPAEKNDLADKLKLVADLIKAWSTGAIASRRAAEELASAEAVGGGGCLTDLGTIRAPRPRTDESRLPNSLQMRGTQTSAATVR